MTWTLLWGWRVIATEAQEHPVGQQGIAPWGHHSRAGCGSSTKQLVSNYPSMCATMSAGTARNCRALCIGTLAFPV